MELKSGYKQSEVGVIPEDWAVDTLASVTSPNMKNGIVDGPFGSNLKTIHYRKSGIPIITSGYVTEGIFKADSYLHVDEEKFRQEKRSAVSPGDIVMAKIGARCGASAILPEWHQTGILSGNALKITVDNKRHSAYYVWQVLWKLYSFGNMESLRTVGAQPAISMARLKEYRIPLPPRPEQVAIARALSDSDEVIGTLDKLIVKKRNLKRAAMQQLLTGKTRLPGFERKAGHKITEVGVIPDDWDVRTCEEMCIKIQDGTHFSPNLGGNDRLYVTSRNIGFGVLDVTNAERIDEMQHRKIYARCDTRKGDLLLTKDGANTGNAAINDLDEECSLLSSVAFLRFDHARHDARFYLQCILSPAGQKRIKELMSGNAITRLTLAKIKRFTLPSPQLSEQRHIAAILSDMDAEIAMLEQKRDKTRAVKQGMMQELLTGKTRLI